MNITFEDPVSISHYLSPIGDITMAAYQGSLIGLWFDGQKYDRRIICGQRTVEREDPVLCETKKWLDIYFKGEVPGFLPSIDIVGTPFQKMVGEILLTIPYGQTMTYGEIAKIAACKMGKKSMSAQAVGGAVGHNSISILVPCHRVLGADGSLTGYAGGIDKKIFLLKNEKILIPEDILT